MTDPRLDIRRPMWSVKDMYADLLKAAYETIKEVDPTARVVDAHPDAWLVFGLDIRYLFGDGGYLGRPVGEGARARQAGP